MIAQRIQIACVNDIPTIVSPTSASAYAGIPTGIDVMSNISDVDQPYVNQTFTFVPSQPAQGSVTSTATGFIYTASGGYSGNDTFQYTATDQSGATSNTGTVNITVTIFNTPPTASGATFSVNEDTITSGTLTGSDAESPILTFTVVTPPGSGSLSLASGGNYTYSGNTNYN